MQRLEKTVAEVFLQMAEGLEKGTYGPKIKIALTGMGSELGEENALEGAVKAAEQGIEVWYIGTLSHPLVKSIPVLSDEEGHRKMDELLDSKKVDGAVTMHYPFPIGVSTVGRVVTPSRGKEMYIATTTGTASSDRLEGMIKNALYGLITAKAAGMQKPTLGILNIDGARQTEIALNKLKEKGYDFTWAKSNRADGGAIMRGNDVLQGVPDVLVTDPLTGNVILKMLSAYTTGGNYESQGSGYGPGIGIGYNKLIHIISRASGAPLITKAILYAAQMVRGKVFEVAASEFSQAENAGLTELLKASRGEAKGKQEEKQKGGVKIPPQEPCTGSIAGVEVMDLDDAAKSLWQAGIYAETGMGCTGPILMLAKDKEEAALEILRKAGFVG